MVGISVQIKAGFTKESCEITATGTVLHVITDKEAEAFGIDDESLKNAIEKYFDRKPNEAYLHGPADDLYKTYKWEEVQIVLEAISATIIDVTSEPKIIEKKISKNNHRNKATFSMDITQSVETTAESNWSTTETITMEQSINYGIKILGTGTEGTTSFSFSRELCQGGSKSHTHTIGSTHGVEVELDPGEAVLGELTASKGTMKAKIVYEAKLIGTTAVRYHPKHKDHYYWSLDIRSVMEAGGISNSKQLTEDIEIGFFGNSDVILTSIDGSGPGPNKSKEDKGEVDSTNTDENSDTKRTTSKDNDSGSEKSKKDKGEVDSTNTDENSDTKRTTIKDNDSGSDKSKKDKGEGDSMKTDGNSDTKRTTTKNNDSRPDKSKKDKGEGDGVNADVSIGNIRDYTHITLIATATGTINFKYYRKLRENTLTLK
jgi:hypothetical protein